MESCYLLIFSCASEVLNGQRQAVKQHLDVKSNFGKVDEAA